MLTAPGGRTLTNLTVPTVFGLLGMVAFNLADTFFVGQLGTQQLAAMSFTFPVVMVVLSIANGIGQGGGALIAHAIGEGDQAKVRRISRLLLIWVSNARSQIALREALTTSAARASTKAAPDVPTRMALALFHWVRTWAQSAGRFCGSQDSV